MEDSAKDGSTGFYENGLLRYCELSEDFTIEGQRFGKGDALRFDRDRKLVADKK